ncbi:OFA family MFS transporter [Lactobacillus mulieris]|uniref:L-lactate MFS transporter n=1 Tax=Lactobacillus mulieris TaxID=2508708 RepID=UPI001F2B627F|nr:OFA family MFS transporter [Lactobacillus mulieris]MCF1783782.1 OFA family MFS transporter [Lactobacillus mulieris]MCW8105125.1 OFA family MFS transporter [Lactobacillus mulieris]
MKRNRYVVALAGVVLHLMIGSVYAWSVFTKPIAAETGWSIKAVTFAFSLAIFFLGMSAAFMGRLVEKYGPTVTGTVSAILFGLGVMLTGVAIGTHQLWLLYVCYGVIGGVGLGAGYVTPVSTIIKWFPDKRGLATGLAIMGFGFAALLTSTVANHLLSLKSVGLEKTFYILGAVYLVVMLLAAQLIKRPRPGEVPTQTNLPKNSTGIQMRANDALKTPAFYCLWFMFFINITTSIGLVSMASPMAQGMVNMNAAKAAALVGIIGLFNGFGRLIWASLSDYIGRPLTYTLIFVVDILCLGTILYLRQELLFSIALCLLLSCYGAGFSVIPVYLGDVFGTRELGALHGYTLTAWAVAGMVGPTIITYTSQGSDYSKTLLIFIIIDVISLLVSFFVKTQIKHMKKA